MAVSAPPTGQAQRGIPTVALAIGGLVLIVVGLFFPVGLATVEIKALPVFYIGSYAVTNSQITGILSLVLLAVLFGLGTRSMSLVPSGLQNIVEAIVEGLVGLAENVGGRAKGREFFALFATIFLYVLANNWLELLPGFTNSTIFVTNGQDKVPLFRSPSADLNFTLALALSAIFMVQFWGVRHTGWGGWAGRFFNFRGGAIGVFVGILELFSEVARIVSLTFRLFGNLFAGEVLLSVIPALVPLVVVLPFMFLEMFVGVVQALIFALLALAFSVMSTISHGGGGEHGH
jgi:F-type H+-transporting ATPase subunit a